MLPFHSTRTGARGTRAACHVVALMAALAAGSALAVQPVPAAIDAPDALLQQVAPSPLLAIDQNRSTVVERIVSEWGEALVQSNAGIDVAQLRTLLNAMRADHLLAASLAGNLEGLRNVVAGALTSEAAVKPQLLQTKALGNAGSDLVYTPIAPCRIVDTVSVGGAIAALGTRSFKGTTATNFTAQGGSNSTCGIPLDAAGLQTTVTVVSPPQNGYLLVYPFNTPQPTAFTMIYQANTIASTAVTIPLTKGQANEFTAFLERTAFLQVDVVGYFKPPAGGYVSGVTAGAGLTGGTISSSGTLAVDTAVIQSRVTGTCAAGSSMRTINANGTVVCEVDDVGGSGTVTSVATGAGLTGGPITAAGTVAIAAGGVTSAMLAQSGCANGQVLKWNGSAWACAADAAGPANAFVQGGNAFGAEAVLGTTDNQSLDIRVNNARVMRYEPNAISPNVIGGSPANNVTAGVRGATIAGGGVPASNTDPDFAGEAPNRVTDAYGTVGGGFGNIAGDDAALTTDSAFATVGGGYINRAGARYSTVGGGIDNIAGAGWSTVAGGHYNITGGFYSTIGGGNANRAGGIYSTVGGGFNNYASGPGSTVGGGGVRSCGTNCVINGSNIASGQASTVPGGWFNIASGSVSWAGGTRARTQTADATPVPHDGAFVWADSSNFDVDFRSTANNEFAVRATGGARFVTAIDGGGNPTRTTRINPNAELEFGSNERQMLNLWAAQYGIGVQAFTMYFRTDGGYSWHRGGTHSNNANDPGVGGTELMRLQSNGTLLVTGGTVGTLSDRTAKRNFAAIDAEQVLAKVVSLPLSEWSYTMNPLARHVGPMSQDFREAFGLGDDDKSIATVDADGVALAAIQGLNTKLEATIAEQARERKTELAQRDAEIQTLRDGLARQRAEIAELRATRDDVATLKAAMAELLRERAGDTLTTGQR